MREQHTARPKNLNSKVSSEGVSLSHHDKFEKRLLVVMVGGCLYFIFMLGGMHSQSLTYLNIYIC